MEISKENSESGPINVVADAVVVILIEKLQKLRSVQEVCAALKRLVKVAISKLQQVYSFLKDKYRSESHPEWTERLLRALYGAENRIDIFMCRIVEHEQETFKIVPDVLMTLAWKCLLFQGMNHFVKEIDGLLQDQHLDHQAANSSAHPSEGRQHYERWHRVNANRDDPSDISSYRVAAYEEVIRRLLHGDDDYLDSIVIYGDEGSGKTYLAGRIFNQSKIKNHFECRAWVHVSSGLTLNDIRYAVLKQVKGSNKVLKNIEHMDQDDVKQSLIRELGNKRYLVVLDDFNNNDTWYDFIQYLPDWSNKSRVLVTTRSRHMAHVVDFIDPIKLKNLREDESERLLKKKVNPVIPSLLNKEKLSRQIFQKSSGSPLAICLLGGLLIDPSQDEWLLKNEKVSLPDILALSYNSLPQEEKPCFLYLTLFPKATPIPVRRILRLWLGEGLLAGHHMNPEDQGEKYLEDLIMRNLVEVVSWKPNGTPQACQVVTSVYDMFRPQAVKQGLLHIHDQKLSEASQTESVRLKGQQFNVHWLAEYSNIKSFCQSNLYSIQHIRSFMSFHSRKGTLTKDIGTFLRIVTSHNNFRLLRVLDLEGVYKPYLIAAIGRLVLLKYLGLRSTVLDSLPDPVGNLPQLETLDIKNTNITVLPRSIWKSNCLRHLYLNGFHIDPSILRRYTSSGFLSNLRTLTGLYMGNIDKSSVHSLIASVTNLTKLKINYQSSDKHESIAEWISKLTNLQSLKLGIIEKDTALPLPNLTYLPEHHHLLDLYLLGKLPNMEANQLPSCLRVLTLSKSELSIDPMHSLGQLQQLISLRLLSKSYIGNEMRCLTKGFPRLQVLKIWSLTKLQKLTVEKDCMSSLKEIEIRDCVVLKFDEITGLEHLGKLEELILSKMPKMFVRDARGCKLLEKCCVFEFGGHEPSETLPQEQIKEGQEDRSYKDKVDSIERPPVMTPMIPQTVNLNEGPSQTLISQNTLSEEDSPPSSIPTTPKNGDHEGPSLMDSTERPPPIDHKEPSLTDHKEPSLVVSPITPKGPGGGHPFVTPAGPGGGSPFAM